MANITTCYTNFPSTVTRSTNFAKLFDQYHEVDHEVRRIEQGIETPADEYTEEVKKKRLALKDELFQMLQAA